MITDLIKLTITVGDEEIRNRINDREPLSGIDDLAEEIRSECEYRIDRHSKALEELASTMNVQGGLNEESNSPKRLLEILADDAIITGLVLGELYPVNLKNLQAKREELYREIASKTPGTIAHIEATHGEISLSPEAPGQSIFDDSACSGEIKSIRKYFLDHAAGLDVSLESAQGYLDDFGGDILALKKAISEFPWTRENIGDGIDFLDKMAKAKTPISVNKIEDKITL